MFRKLTCILFLDYIRCVSSGVWGLTEMYAIPTHAGVSLADMSVITARTIVSSGV